MPAAPAQPRHVSPYLLLTLAPFFWSSNWIIGRALHDDIPPMGMTFFRWLFAVLILAPFALPKLRRDWPVVRAQWKTMLLLGSIGVGTHNALAYIGLNYTTATNGVILNSFIPVILAWLFLDERLYVYHVAGIALILTGIALTTRRGRAVAPAGTD